MSLPPPSAPPPAPAPTAPPRAVPTDPCAACGEPVPLSAAACPRCAFPRRAPTATAAAAGRPPRTAMWLSLLWPGAGHLYAGRTEKGYVLCGVTAVLVVLSLTVVGPVLSLVAVLALALYAALDCNGALG